ncbi:hypothetical protein JZU54_01090, partial [bacterium]|nr:hypothetical protein [bacterium]
KSAHVLLALLQQEGGIAARAARYQANNAALIAAMQGIGLKSYLPPAVQSHIITSFVYPKDSAFVWTEFYRLVAEKGFLLYPGKISQADTFRIGNIGEVYPSDIERLLKTWESKFSRDVESLGEGCPEKSRLSPTVAVKQR